MAIFDPALPATQDPNYLNYSRAIDAPSPNTSTKIALETAGTAIERGASALDLSLKKGLQDTINKKVDVMRDDFTAGLEKVKSNLDSGLIPTGVGKDKSLLSDDSEANAELPVGLESGLSRVQQIAYAKAAGSPKINDTAYAKDTLSLAKQLRSQYPGYRDYIDQEVSKASGLPVANSYYSNLMLDINRQLAQMGKQKDDVGKLMMQNLDVPNMNTYIDRRNAGDKTLTDSFVIKQISSWQNLQSTLKIDAARRVESTAAKADKVEEEKGNLTRNLNNFVDHVTRDNLQLSGMPTYKELTDFMDDVSAGRRPNVGDTEVQQRAAQLSVYRNYLYKEAKKIANGPDAIIGSDVAEKQITAALAPIDNYITFANSKETGPAFFSLRQNLAIMEDEKKNNWLFNKDRGAISRNMMGARAIMGEQYFPDYIRSILATGADKPIADLFSQEALGAVKPYEDIRGKPIERTLKDAIQHGKKMDVPDPEYYGKVIGLVTKIADPNMPLPAKENLINWAFQPKNYGVLNELKEDYVDPNTGQTVPGKYRAFNLMTSQGISMNIAKASEAKPELYDKYRSWTEQEYGTLFRSDVAKLNQAMEKPYLGVHFSYNDKTNDFGLVDKMNRPIARNDRALGVENPNAVYINGMLDTLERVNGGLHNLASMHKRDPNGPEDTPAYLIKTLQTIGFRPGDLVTGATEGMTRALIKTRNPDISPEQLNKMLLSRTPEVPAQDYNYNKKSNLKGNVSDYDTKVLP